MRRLDILRRTKTPVSRYAPHTLAAPLPGVGSAGLARTAPVTGSTRRSRAGRVDRRSGIAQAAAVAGLDHPAIRRGRPTAGLDTGVLQHGPGIVAAPDPEMLALAHDGAASLRDTYELV
ncbi:MAG: hypothetical protein WBR28_25665 [Mycobacterium sp.]